MVAEDSWKKRVASKVTCKEEDGQSVVEPSCHCDCGPELGRIWCEIRKAMLTYKRFRELIRSPVSFVSIVKYGRAKCRRFTIELAFYRYHVHGNSGSSIIDQSVNQPSLEAKRRFSISVLIG